MHDDRGGEEGLNRLGWACRAASCLAAAGTLFIAAFLGCEYNDSMKSRWTTLMNTCNR